MKNFSIYFLHLYCLNPIHIQNNFHNCCTCITSEFPLWKYSCGTYKSVSWIFAVFCPVSVQPAFITHVSRFCSAELCWGGTRGSSCMKRLLISSNHTTVSETLDKPPAASTGLSLLFGRLITRLRLSFQLFHGTVFSYPYSFFDPLNCWLRHPTDIHLRISNRPPIYRLCVSAYFSSYFIVFDLTRPGLESRRAR